MSDESLHLKISLKTLQMVGWIVGLLVVFVLILFVIVPNLPQPVSAVTDTNNPVTTPSIELISVTLDNCTNCIPLAGLISTVKQQVGIPVTERIVSFGSDESNTLIQEYGIERLPSVVIRGDLNSFPELVSGFIQSGLGYQSSDGSLVFKSPFPVYYEIASGKLTGLVQMTKITVSDCTECSPGLTEQDFSSLSPPIAFESIQEISSTSAEGQALLAKYNIRKIPTIVLSKEIKEYPQFQNFLSVGTVEQDGSFIFRNTLPYFFDLDQNRIVGGVQLISIVDSNCSECITQDRISVPLIDRLGLQISSTQTVDLNSSEAQELIQKYSLTSLPSVLFSGDLNAYFLVGQYWPQLGRLAEDQMHIFTEYSLLEEGYYKDINSGQLIQIIPSEPIVQT
ncbi:MAG: hypothetical protein Q7S92_05350 [Candidatus Diapherotrites archaeon]|nr:hypothetical protein [Candidatus Diapherotrites archaeon]